MCEVVPGIENVAPYMHYFCLQAGGRSGSLAAVPSGSAEGDAVSAVMRFNAERLDSAGTLAVTVRVMCPLANPDAFFSMLLQRVMSLS